MAVKDIYDAFAVEFSTLAANFTPAVPVYWPEAMPDDESLIPDSLYFDVRFIPNNNSVFSLDGEETELKGIFRIIICDKSGQGLWYLHEYGEAIQAAFPANKLIDIAHVTMLPNIGSSYNEKGIVKLPITIDYRAMRVDRS